MLSLYVVLPLLTLAAIIQNTLLTQVALLGGQPDLVFLLVVVWAFLRGPEEGAVWAFIGGLLLDLFSGGPFGGFALAFILVSFFMSQRWGQELGSIALQLILLTLIAGFAYHVFLLLILSWTGYAADWQYGLSRIAAPSAILNGILAPFIHRPLSWLDRRTRPMGVTFDGA